MDAATRAGVIGLGRVGAAWDIIDEKRAKPSTHTGAWVKLLGPQNVYVYDVYPPPVKRACDFFGCQSAPVLAHLALDCDVVSVATPIDTHADIVKALASDTRRERRLKVIFCEKPIAATTEEAKEMVEACKKAGVKLAVNHSRRWNSLYREVARVLPKNGPTLDATGYFTGDVLNVASHLFDLLNWYGVDKAHILRPEVNYLLFELDIVWRQGRIKVLQNGAKAEFYEAVPSQRYDDILELKRKRVLYHHDLPPTDILLACKQLLTCVANPKEEPYCSGGDGLLSLKRALSWMDVVNKD